MGELNSIIAEAASPDDYADRDQHIYALYDLVERLAGEVKRLSG